MEALVLALLLLAAVLVSSVIDQLVPKISSPLIQIGLGLLIALLAPAQINITLDPELFLVLFIAPLLFDEAKNVDKGALWKLSLIHILPCGWRSYRCWYTPRFLTQQLPYHCAG